MSRQLDRKTSDNYFTLSISKTAAYVGPLALLIMTQPPGLCSPTPNTSAVAKRLPDTTPETSQNVSGYLAAYNPISVPNYPAKTAWYQEGIEKIDAMQSIAPNWDTYGAEPPTEATLTKTKAVMETLYQMNFQPSRIAASAEGGVAISFFDKTRYSDIEILNTGDVLAATSIGDGNPNVWEVSAEDLGFVKTMETIREFIRAK